MAGSEVEERRKIGREMKEEGVKEGKIRKIT